MTEVFLAIWASGIAFTTWITFFFHGATLLKVDHNYITKQEAESTKKSLYIVLATVFMPFTLPILIATIAYGLTRNLWQIHKLTRPQLPASGGKDA